jgi:nitronate monooxygenase
MDGRGIAAALMLGAQAVQMGTAFLSCIESAAHPAWKMKIRTATDTTTAITRAFSGRAARGIINTFMQRMKSCESQVPPYPIQNALTAEIRQAAGLANRPEFLSLWAGQAAGLARNRKVDLHAAELMQQLSQELAGLI